jgi:tetratricopeptide (TPR) repeat protein
MSGPRSSHVLAVAAALVVLTFAAFWPVLSAGFVKFDDDYYVTENRHVLAGLSGTSIAWAATTTACGNWHPVTWLSHLADVSLFGLDAGRHHRTSLLIHAANTALLFYLLFRMTGALWRSAFASALFSLHPLHVESVAWIAERKDVLSTSFWFLTILAWLRFTEARTAGRYAMALAAFAIGLMTKPMLVTLPFTLILLDVWPLDRAKFPPLWMEKLPLFAMSAASCVITLIAQKSGGAVQTLGTISFGERVAHAIVSYVGYLAKTVWPESLAVFYPYPSYGPSAGIVAVSAVFLAAATFFAVRLIRQAPYLAVGWLWYLGTLLPVIGLVQVGSQSMADRYTYVPLVGIFIAVAWGLAALVPNARVARIGTASAAAVVLCACVIATRAQAAVWSDSVTLFEHALSVTKDSWLVHANLGGALLDRGRFEEAIAEEREALRIRPNYTVALSNLGQALEQTGRHDEAIEQFELSLRLRPDDANTHNNLAGVLVAQGRNVEAMRHAGESVRLAPEDGMFHRNYAGLLADAGRIQDAIEQLEAAVRLQPDDSEARAELENLRAQAQPRP